MEIMESYEGEFLEFARNFKKSLAEFEIASGNKADIIIKDLKYYA